MKPHEKFASEKVLDDLIKGIKEKCEELHIMKERFFNELKDNCNIDLNHEEIQPILTSFPDIQPSPEFIAEYCKILSKKYQKKLLKNLQIRHSEHLSRLIQLKSTYKSKLAKSKLLIKGLSTLKSGYLSDSPTKSFFSLTSSLIKENQSIRSQLK